MEKEENSLGGCLVVAVLGVIVWVLFSQGPISWYVLAAIGGYVVLLALCDWAEGQKKSGMMRDRIVASTLDDGRKIFRNLAVALGFVLVLQICLNLFASSSDPTIIGTMEQRTWDFLARLTSFGSLKVAALVTLAAIILSALIGNVLPIVLSGKARKLVSTTAALLATVMMFSFVTKGAAEQNFAQAVGPIRARLVSRLEDTAKARQEAVAYSWILAAIEEKQRSEPSALSNIALYFNAGERTCDQFEAVYQAEIAVRSSVASAAGSGSLELCDKTELLRAMTPRLIGSDAAAELPPLKRRPWLADFAGYVVAAPDNIAGPFSFGLKSGRLADTEELSAKVEKAATEAEAARGVMRGLATKSMATVIGSAFSFDGAVGEVVDTLRDAVLIELAKLSENKIREMLVLLARHRDGSIADVAARLHRATFPEQPFSIEGFPSEANALDAAKATWISLHPTAGTSQEVQTMAATAVKLAIEREEISQKLRALGIETRYRTRPPEIPHYDPRPPGRR